jgi:replicative DNA helicase
MTQQVVEKKHPWKSQKEGFLDSLVYIKGRQEGVIKSLLTPWDKFNNAGTNGIEWGSTVIICGRPGAFKTGCKDQIVRSAFKLNPGEDFRVLEFELEMLARTSAIREYSSVLGKSYDYICSAEGDSKISDEDIELCYKHAQARVKYPIDIVDEAPTVNEFKDIIHRYMEEHSKTNVLGVRVYKNTIITLDHTILIKLAPFEKTTNDMLYNLGKTLTDLKRRYPIIFIILSQLNRDIDKPERNEDGRYGNYVLDSDLFGSDAMLMHADMVVGLNRPGKQQIRFYGPERYIIEDKSVLVMHFLKVRNGEAQMSFFRADFGKMQIIDMETPQKADFKKK